MSSAAPLLRCFFLRPAKNEAGEGRRSFSKSDNLFRKTQNCKRKKTSFTDVFSGRGDATRTRNPRFWRPLLYQLSHSPICAAALCANSRYYNIPSASSQYFFTEIGRNSGVHPELLKKRAPCGSFQFDKNKSIEVNSNRTGENRCTREAPRGLFRTRKDFL